jgi:hypothetical protein
MAYKINTQKKEFYMKNRVQKISKGRLIFLIAIVALQSACSGGGSNSDDIESTNVTDTCDEPLTSLSGAYLEFDLATNVISMD